MAIVMGLSCAASAAAYSGSAFASLGPGWDIAAMYAMAFICVSAGMPEPTVSAGFGIGRGGIAPSHVDASAGEDCTVGPPVREASGLEFAGGVGLEGTDVPASTS
jgi:hypothetical protein